MFVSLHCVVTLYHTRAHAQTCTLHARAHLHACAGVVDVRAALILRLLLQCAAQPDAPSLVHLLLGYDVEPSLRGLEDSLLLPRVEYSCLTVIERALTHQGCMCVRVCVVARALDCCCAPQLCCCPICCQVPPAHAACAVRWALCMYIERSPLRLLLRNGCAVDGGGVVPSGMGPCVCEPSCAPCARTQAVALQAQALRADASCPVPHGRHTRQLRAYAGVPVASVGACTSACCDS